MHTDPWEPTLPLTLLKTISDPTTPLQPFFEALMLVTRQGFTVVYIDHTFYLADAHGVYVAPDTYQHYLFPTALFKVF